MPTKRLFVLLFPLLFAACTQEADDREMVYTRYTGTAAWTIDGARPGMTLAELKLLLGPPADSSGDPPTSVSWGYPSQGLTVNVDANGRVTQVWGKTLKAGDVTVLGGGVSDAEIKGVLGKGESKSMTQSGSFVLPTPGKTVGAEHFYRNGDVRFRFIVMKGEGLTGIVAETQ
jgi:hypothetical protein